MRWSAEQYAAAAGIPLRTARYRLARWFAQGAAAAVRVEHETPATHPGAPPCGRYVLDVASYRARLAGAP